MMRVPIRAVMTRMGEARRPSVARCFNAAKYGALSVLGGQVSISWQENEQMSPLKLLITWQESGGPVASEPQQRGDGLKLIERLLTRGLAGQIQLAFHSQGLQATMTFPITEPDRSEGSSG